MNTALERAITLMSTYKTSGFTRETALTTAKFVIVGADDVLEQAAKHKYDGEPLPRETAPDAFEALTQPPTETVPVESTVLPPDRESTPVNPILQAALRCVEKGWYVFALEERGKRPDS